MQIQLRPTNNAEDRQILRVERVSKRNVLRNPKKFAEDWMEVNKQRKEWLQIFREFDRDPKDGFLDVREVRQAFLRIGLPDMSIRKTTQLVLKYSRTDVKVFSAAGGRLMKPKLDKTTFLRLCNDVATKGVDTIVESVSKTLTDVDGPSSGSAPPITNFYSRWSKVMLDAFMLPFGERDWELLFDKYDTDPKDGLLAAREMKVCIKAISKQDVPIAVVRKLVAQYDIDGDGLLGMDEYKRMLRQINANGQGWQGLLGYSGWETSEGFIGCDVADMYDTDEHWSQTINGQVVTDVDVKNAISRDAGDALFKNAEIVLNAQDLLFARFKSRYVGPGKAFSDTWLGDVLNPEKILLLKALKDGDVPKIKQLMTFSWDFIFPPATSPTDGTEARENEGWCRSPLALLVRPDEGTLTPMLPGVPNKLRLELIKMALDCGCATPDFPTIYWSCPAVHACFEGDVEALALLAKAGGDMEQGVEWMRQRQPYFSLVHAAAFNGQLPAMEFLESEVPATFMHSLDADGSNPLQVCMESSGNEELGAWLIQKHAVNGFGLNCQSRSPLSVSIERSPRIATMLLNQKSQFEYSWWGNELYIYSFEGVVLPSWEGGALRVRDLKGSETTIEGLIVANECKEALDTKLMRALIDLKWKRFAAEIYQTRVIKYFAMGGLFFLNSFSMQPDFIDQLHYTWLPRSLVVCSTLYLWYEFVEIEIAEVKRAREDSPDQPLTETYYSSFWNFLDSYNLTVLPFLLIISFLSTEYQQSLQSLKGLESLTYQLNPLTQISVALRALQFASCYQQLGPLWVTTTSMLKDAGRFVGLYAFVLFGFTNALFVIFNTAVPGSGDSIVDVSYLDVISMQLFWVLGDYDLSKFGMLSDTLGGVGLAVFWASTLGSFFIFLNLLIAIFNSTYSRVEMDAEREWLFLRLDTMLEFEVAENGKQIDEFYTELESLNNKRALAVKKEC